jgi:putative tricarboxylic transport membrane protein
MDDVQNIVLGFSVVFTPINILYCFIGVFLGTLVGVLPGIGTICGLAILLPFTFDFPPITAIIMLAGIWYGAMYGGSTTSILVNIPGEPESVVTALDGYQMARQGRAGRALGIAAFGSFIAGTIGIILLMLMAPTIARFAVKFGPAEFFALISFGLILSAYLTSGSMIKGFAMIALGMIIGTVGQDLTSGYFRFTFNSKELLEGVGLVPIVMGLFGIAEVLINLEEIFKRDVFKTHLNGLLPNKEDWKASAGPIARGTLLGFFIGILPGPGTVISSFISYAVEKRISKHPEKFGKGAIEGVAGPEAANNAASAGAFVTLFTFGIPTGASMALLLGALLIHGISPGPLLITEHPEVFWGVICSMYIGNVMLLILNLPLIGIWVKLLRTPYGILFPLILLVCLIGVYSTKNSLFDINMMIFFGLIGYLMRKMQFEAAPLILAYVLCPIWEESFRRSLLVSGGDVTLFFMRPIPAFFFTIAFLFVLSSIFPPKTIIRLLKRISVRRKVEKL